MAGMRFIDIVTDHETITQLTGERAFVKRLCNLAVAHICGLAEWPFLWTTDWFQTVAPYTTGTVSVTNGSATVTGTGTVFTSAMVGRKIRIGSDTAYYYVKSVASDTSLTLGIAGGLDQPYQGTTDTAATYSIFKDEYLLRADLDSQKRLRNSDNGYAFFSLSATEFDEWFPSVSGEGSPSLDVYVGRAVKTYTTGTIQGTSGSRVLTGASTAWTGAAAEGITKGTKLKVGSLLFTVNTLDSATQITIYEALTAAISAGTSYTAVLDNPVVQLHSIPDAIETIYYRFQRLPAVLDADNDIPDIPYPMHPLIGLAMLPAMWRFKGFMDRVTEAQAAFGKELSQWLTKYQLPVLDQKRPLYPFSLSQRLPEARWPVGTGVPLGY